MLGRKERLGVGGSDGVCQGSGGLTEGRDGSDPCRSLPYTPHTQDRGRKSVGGFHGRGEESVFRTEIHRDPSCRLSGLRSGEEMWKKYGPLLRGFNAHSPPKEKGGRQRTGDCHSAS